MGRMKDLAISLQESMECWREDEKQGAWIEDEERMNVIGQNGNTGCHYEDNVNHPPHYTQGGIECIAAIKAALTSDEFRGYCKGNAIKYIWRERYKGNTESLMKAIWYLKELKDVPSTF